MAITVYTLPECAQCETTKKYLEKNNLAYLAVDLSENPKEYEVIRSLGYDRVPVVIADESHWSGFRPDKLFKLTRINS
jgi:glutaredoxin-like protein NrdH